MTYFFSKRTTSCLFRRSVIGAVFLVVCAALSITSYADTYTMPLTTVFDVINSPGPVFTNAAVGTATFQDVSFGVVGLTLAFNRGNIGGSNDQVSAWGIDVTNTFGATLTFTLQSKTPGLATPLITQTTNDTQKMDGGFYVNVFMNTFNGTFVSGDSITFDITSSKPDLTASDFVDLCSTTSNSYSADTWYSVLQVYQPGGGYFNLGAPTVVPEPATVSLVVLGLLGVLTLIRRRQ